MSKSLGNFFTLRDLFAKGQKPSAIRYLLLSVPYRRQLNFTGDSLTQAENSVTRLRNFYARLKTEQFNAGETPEIQARAAKAEADFDSGLADDLNTAFSLAVIFDLVRDVNTAMDKGEFRQQDAPRLIAAMEKFDAIFAILDDNDAEVLQRMGFTSGEKRMPAEEVEALIEERNAAKKKRDFKRADEIRKKLADSGIILEDSKDGSVRWKYK
jgi:cysteinyl-tRNA synthetase